MNTGGIKYTDLERTVWVYGEVLTSDVAYFIECWTMHYWGDKNARVDEVLRKEIAGKIKDAFLAHGLLLDVE